jgi:hypothetical protein
MIGRKALLFFKFEMLQNLESVSSNFIKNTSAGWTPGIYDCGEKTAVRIHCYRQKIAIKKTVKVLLSATFTVLGG